MGKYPPVKNRSTNPQKNAGKGDVRRLTTDYTNEDKYDQWTRSKDARDKGKENTEAS